MPPFFQRTLAWKRAALAVLWAGGLSFTLYMLIQETPQFSRSKFGLSVLFFLLLVLIAYRNLPGVRFLSPRARLILMAGSGLPALLGGAFLFFHPEKTILISPQHELRIEVIHFSEGQVFRIVRLQTSLETVSNDSFQNLEGWARRGNMFTPASNASSLTWTGWTGSQSQLYLSGTPEVTVKVTWDDTSRVIDFAQTDGNAVVKQAFPMPPWEVPLLFLLLWIMVLYPACMVCVNWQVSLPGALLPPAVGSIFLAGLLSLFILLILSLPVENLELLLVLTLACLSLPPVYLISRRLPQSRLGRLAKFWPGTGFNRFSTPFILGFSLLMAIGIFGGSLWAKWSMTDDHEIVSFLGPAGKMSFGQIFAILPQTEVGAWGATGRFRPTYYFLRLLECVLWGAHPLYWHAARILLLALGLSLFWLLMRPSLGWLASGLLCAYALTFPYWVDVIGRLGPGETYAAAGLPLYLWGTAHALQEPQPGAKRQFLIGAAMLAGGVICIGSKENFVLLIFPTIYVACRSLKRKQPILFAASLGAALFASFVGGVVLLAITRSGRDVYSNPVSPLVRLETILGVLQNDPQNLAALGIFAGLIALLCLIYLKRDPTGKTARWVRHAQFWLILLGVLYLSQLFFYNGIWPTGSRYDFPGLLYIPAAVYILFELGRKIMPESGGESQTPLLKTSLILSLIIVIAGKGYASILQSVEDNVKATNEFTAEIETISSTLKAHPGYALVIESGRAIDYEPVLSYTAFLRTEGAGNPFFLRLHGYSPATAAPGLESQLATSLWNLSTRGNRDFLPLDHLSSFGNKCFSLNLSGASATGCTPLP